MQDAQSDDKRIDQHIGESDMRMDQKDGENSGNAHDKDGKKDVLSNGDPDEEEALLAAGF